MIPPVRAEPEEDSHEDTQPRRLPSPALGRLVFLGVFLASSLYVLGLVDRGWVPHDEGTLAQPAARVLLHDQLPHRDFDDMYTGGQALYHAAVFRVLGVELLSLRLALFGAFVLSLPLLWLVARRFAGPVAAGVGVLVAVAWSIPAYPAAMPSWYNLFLALAAVAAGLRHLETERRGWLVVAGACAGLSVTVKVAGFYMLAALLLFAVHREQELARGAMEHSPEEPIPAPTARIHSLVVTAALALFVAAVTTLVLPLAAPATFLHFALPPAALAGWLAWREWRVVPAAPGRSARLAGLIGPVMLGFALPTGLFLAPYLSTGSVGELLEGVFVLPAERFHFTSRLPPAPITALPLAALLGVIVWASRVGRRVERALAVAVALPLLAVLLLGNHPPLYRAGWWLLRPLIPLLVLAGVALLAGFAPRWDGAAPWDGVPRRSAPRDPGGADPGPGAFFLLLSATAMASLVQYPTSAPVYFFYVAPLAALLGLALVASLPRPPWRIAGVVASFHVLFAVAWIHTGWVYQMGDRYAAHPPTEVLDLERGGIRVVPGEKAEMEQLVALLDRVAPGPWIWATPDAPEVYFLAERRNPTRTLFDFFEEREGREERILEMLDERDVEAVVFNTGPARFSGLPSLELQKRIAERYPHGATVGRFFVRWKAAPGPGG